MEIGARLKEMRLQKNLTQEELADRCELTKGYISQLENELTSPSIATLTDILTLLGSSLKEFFSDDEPEQVVFTDADYFIKNTDDSSIKWLVPTSQKNMIEPVLLELSPHAQTDADNPHEGEEFGYVLEGSIVLELGKSVYRVNEGDSFYFTAERKHRLKNDSDEKAVVIWVSCPPNF